MKGSGIPVIFACFAYMISSDSKCLNHLQNITADSWFNVWIAEYKEPTVKTGTITVYKDTYAIYIRNLLGKQRLKDIRVEHIQKLYNDMHREGYSRNTIELGLEWKDVDFANKQIHVNGTLVQYKGKLYKDSPKTASSKRTVPMLGNVHTLLKQQKKEQKKRRMLTGREWKPMDRIVELIRAEGLEFESVHPHTCGIAKQHIGWRMELTLFRFHHFLVMKTLKPPWCT